MRFEDSPNLFGGGSGSGTCGDIKCQFCGTLYNEGNDEAESYGRDSVTETDFAGLTVCECCFEKIEIEILHRMPDIMSWYRRILEARRKRLSEDEAGFDLLIDLNTDKSRTP